MAKKKWQVIKNTTAEHITGVDVGREKFRFRNNGTFVIDDPQLARDIDKVYGRKGNQQVAVVPHNDPETRELGHTYTFGPTPKFSHAWKAFERRRKRKAQKEGKHGKADRQKKKQAA